MGEYEPKIGGTKAGPDEEETLDTEDTGEITEEIKQPNVSDELEAVPEDEDSEETTVEDTGDLDLESMDDTEHNEEAIKIAVVEFFTESEDTSLLEVMGETDINILKFLLRDDNFIEEIATEVNNKWKKQLMSYADKLTLANERVRFIEDQNPDTLLATGEIKDKDKFALLTAAIKKLGHAIVKVAKPKFDRESNDAEDQFFR